MTPEKSQGFIEWCERKNIPYTIVDLPPDYEKSRQVEAFLKKIEEIHRQSAESRSGPW